MNGICRPATRIRTTVLDRFFLAVLLLAGVGPISAQEAPPEAIEFFEKRVRPILVNHCQECHSAESKKSRGGLRVDTREALRKGGDSGIALVPGDPDASLLIRAVRHATEELRMPPKQKLSDAQIADLVTWVKNGAHDPRTGMPAARRGLTLEEGRAFWSFRPVAAPPPPSVNDASWPLTPVDHFILARLEKANVRPAAPADRRTLLRRATFDLTGLPPTPGEMEDFLADSSPEAFAKVVDRLLASPRYGERWGRHWLDVVRYADTCGNASDYPVPQAHEYRDWVIRAFNRDLPYDRFLREQLAGDLISGGTASEREERIIATGYLAIARRFGGDRMGEHHLTLEDTIDNLGRAVLGFSISCARCHDHKFDPFTMSDYYGLYGIFESTRYPFPGAEVKKEQEDFVPLMSPAEIEAIRKPHREKIARIDLDLKQLEAALLAVQKSADAPEKKASLDAATKALADARKKRADIVAETPTIRTAYAVAEGKPANAKIHLRGDPKRTGDLVPRHFPAVLGGHVLPADAAGSGRSHLAEWVTDVRNPLTARVMVNRIWQYHFGRGIVQTPNDFGRQGKPPTHPELLDFLATRFVESGWSMKAMHRLILLSRTWQLASTEDEATTQGDPTNELFGRFERRRLDAESLRDTILFVSGELDERLGGGHPFPPPPSWKYTQHSPFFAVYETQRRSVYLMQQRLRKHPYLALFDGADPSSSTAVRLPSTTPLQALFLMNGSFAHGMASKFAGRLLAAASDDDARLRVAYQVAMNRDPSPDEQSECTEFLRQYRARLAALGSPAGQRELATWSAFARALMSGNEFVFLD